jgi:hypothetical protein
VRRGDTLWRISGLFLKSPWRWPELWGMNLADIRNPHLIYPGQQLYLERVGDRAFLRARAAGDGEPGDTVRVSPRNRTEVLGAGPLPTLQPHLIEPFLAEPLVVDDDTFQRAPRIVALATRTACWWPRATAPTCAARPTRPLLKGPDLPTDFRVFRTAKPLKDPVSGEILGYEGQYVGQATLGARRERGRRGPGRDQLRPPARAAGGEKSQPKPPGRGHADQNAARAGHPGHRQQQGRNARRRPPAARAAARIPQLRAARARASRSTRAWWPCPATRCATPARTRSWSSTKACTTASRAATCWPCCPPVRRWSTRPTSRANDQAARRAQRHRHGVPPFERVSYVLVMEITNPVQVGDKLVNPR